MPRGSSSGPQTAARIVRTIWLNPRISRIGIAERLGLDKSTVTNQVGRLIELGIIEEVAEGSAGSRGGRRPIHLAISRGYGRVIGIEVQVESYVALAVDLAGEILGEIRGETRVEAEGFSGSVLDIIARAQTELCPEGVRLLGLGVGTGGLIDRKKGRLRYSVPLGISEPLDFEREVASRLSVPCLIENDANCCAWGELAFNKDEALRDFLFALVEYRKDPISLGQYGGLGVGFGVSFGGKVYSGAHGNAGEFRSAFCDGPGSLQFSLRREELCRIDQDRASLTAAADELARNTAMLVNTMDFDRVYIGGDIEALDVDFPGMLRRRLQDNWMYPFPKDVEIRYSSMGDKAVAYGAAGMVLHGLISERALPALAADAEEGAALPSGDFQ
ncbi:MAG TPA: ROK family transcriptional regulator [Rectinemataceae bacterium]|nr:ROK family transcriptional regulator [Rectinemataceae bacterium]